MKYEELKKIDLVNHAVMQKLKRGIYKPEGDKIVFNRARYNPDIPWIHHGYAMDRECARWHNVYFQDYGFIPRECFKCWKIVARPKNFRQLMELNELQETHTLPGKVGMDLRPEAVYKGVFLGFWYCPMDEGLEGARNYFHQIKRSVRGALSLDVPVILKRGCTEMENAFGPSNNWTYPPQWELLQALLDVTFEVSDLDSRQPGWVKTHVMRFWMEYAHQSRDQTVKDFVQHYPESLGAVKTVTYDDVIPAIVMMFPEEKEEESHGEQATEIQGLPED